MPVPPDPPAPLEPTLWQRITDAYTNLARPTTIYMGGFGVLWGTLFHPDPEIIAIAAAMTGAVGYMHGQTKVALANIAAGTGDGK